MADFTVRPLGWVNTPRGGHGRFNTKVLRGMDASVGLAETVDAKPGQGVTPVGVPEMAWVGLPNVDPSQPQYGGVQVDTVIEVDAGVALVIGWVIQKQDGNDVAVPHLGNVQRWNHLMWAIGPLGEPGPAYSLGSRTDYNYERYNIIGSGTTVPPRQESTEESLRWPAHFGIPMGSGKVRLPGDPDTVVSVADDLSITIESGPVDAGFDLGCAAWGDPNTQNAVMAYFEPGVGPPAQGTLRYPDGTVEHFTGPGTPLCNPVDTGGAASWAWLTDEGTLSLATYKLGVGTTTEVLEVPDWVPADPTRQYTLSRFTYPAKSLFVVMRTTHDEANHDIWSAHTILCSFAGPRALTGWTQIRVRTDVDIPPT